MLKTLHALQQFIESNGFAPTYEELAEIVGAGVNTIWRHLMSLEKDGYIKREGFRNITLNYVIQRNDNDT